MGILTANAVLAVDGDAAFLRVNNRLPAHALPPGEVASASNIRFEQGKPRPRYGVALDPWGLPPQSDTNLVIDPQTHNPRSTGTYSGATFSNSRYCYGYIRLTAGVTYLYIPGNELTASFYALSESNLGAPDGAPGAPLRIGTFTTPDDIYTYLYFWKPIDQYNTPITALVYEYSSVHTCGYKRFSDALTNSDNAVLITDDWRDGAGEDGGRGRAWRILSGNVPQEIRLNGHDVWDTCRLVQCDTAMLLLRHGNQRYYFSAAAVNDATNDRIQLNVTPPWVVGTARRVRYELASDGAAIYGTSPPAPGNYYWAKHITGDKIELYTDETLANKLDFEITTNPPTGKFYFEEAITPTPFFGNAARNLVMQPNAEGNTAFEAGFDSVTENVEISDTDATRDTITAGNHRLNYGDEVSGTAIGGVTWPKFAAPQSPHTLKLYDTLEDAQADDGTTGLVNLTTDNETGTLWKTSAAGVPLPSCREGAFLNGRFVGINGRDLVVVSDPGDFLHCTIWQSVVPANQGEAGYARWIQPLGDNVVAVGKDLNVVGIAGLASGDPATWTERNITSEYNGIAAMAAVPVGSDVWFASRKGMCSVVRTVAGETLGTPRTASKDIPSDLQDIDWSNAGIMCAETWNNRLFWGVPTKGQDPVKNNKVLVLNQNNADLRVQQTILAGEIIGGIVGGNGDLDSWEGAWSGDLLTPYAFTKLTINGEERLTFATPDGLVCWLHDGWDDVGAEITSELLTRGYFGNKLVLAIKGAITWETARPKLTVAAQAAGYKESVTVLEDLEYDPVKYDLAGVADYVPAASTIETFEAPHRQDYTSTADELLVAELDVHQTHTEPVRLRLRDRGIQLRVTNTQGSVRVVAVTIAAKPIGQLTAKGT